MSVYDTDEKGNPIDEYGNIVGKAGDASMMIPGWGTAVGLGLKGIGMGMNAYGAQQAAAEEKKRYERDIAMQQEKMNNDKELQNRQLGMEGLDFLAKQRAGASAAARTQAFRSALVGA